MKSQKEKPVRVLFRVDQDNGEIVAVFPDIPGTNDPYQMLCYAHVGQHNACSMDWFYEYTEKAKEGEYQPLKKELELLGYNLAIRSRMTQRMLENRKKALKEI